MKPEYRQWIGEHVKTYEDAYGKCEEITLEMAKAFPELTRQYGQYMCLIWGPRWHWWLMTPEGEVVDPTANQFPTGGCGEYKSKSLDELPYGRCSNCGEEYYTDFSTYFCSEKCADETVTSLNTARHQRY